MRKIKLYLLIALTSLAGVSTLPFNGWAQANTQQPADGADKAISVLRHMAAKYQEAQYLSFDILYRYAAADKPALYLDSLKGQYKLHGSRYWSLIDNRESVYDNNLLVVRFEEDSVLYISAPALQGGERGQQQGPAGQAGTLAILDTMLFANKDARCAYTETDSEQLISMRFEEPAPCRLITWHINRTTGLLTKMISQVRSEQLYDPSVRSLISDTGVSYVIVETIYSNYRQGAFTDSVFDHGKYIKKQGGDYVAAPPYERYKVFVGTPGL